MSNQKHNYRVHSAVLADQLSVAKEEYADKPLEYLAVEYAVFDIAEKFAFYFQDDPDFDKEAFLDTLRESVSD